MDRGLRIHYDVEGDILCLDRCNPYAQQVSDEIAEGVIVRTNPQTGVVETVEILFYKSRALDSVYLNLPSDMRLEPLVETFAAQSSIVS